MTRQLTLTFETPRRLGLAEFAVGEANRAAVEAIGRWPNWPSPVMLLVGEAASGKSHLAAILAAASAAPIFTADTADWHALAAEHAGETVIVEDLDGGIDEAGLFHLINAVTAGGGRLMLTSRTPPAEWRLNLPDLASRLRAATPVMIGAPDDRLMEQLLGKLFVDRQTTVDPQVIRFIAQRIERTFAAAGDAVERLDRAALARKAAITKPFAAEVLFDGAAEEPLLPGFEPPEE
ncbi:MAG: DnaA/Hda family protein [Ancalomicrobiaceae bacterium]|nr:DnaA/Hda family protein [Ancalomicrobiaceae bacterium]